MEERHQDPCVGALGERPDQEAGASLPLAVARSSTSRSRARGARADVALDALLAGSQTREKHQEAITDLIIQYTYPRIDTEVSRKLNHLLKAPFCIHPGTGPSLSLLAFTSSASAPLTTRY